MEHLDLHLVVIAGGSGTRFWPKSTSKKPKQLLSFGQNSSLLAQTVSRFNGLVPERQRIIVTTQSLQSAIQSEKLNVEILAEPQGRNTAPCVYWAARHVAEKNPKGVMLIMPSDHYIADSRKFVEAVRAAANWANQKNDLVTLGIQPSRPETGYGYLKTGESLDTKGSSSVKKVEAFVEKPNLEKAKQFIQSGNYLWNGGMFLWRAETILQSFDQFMPEMKTAWNNAKGKVEVAYPEMTATSIDYGIMEKAKNVVTFPLDCGWDDLGNWTSLDSLADALQARQGANVVTGGEVLAVDSSHNVIDAPNRLVALLGVDDLIVVENGDAILVAKKDRAQDIRKIVDEVKKKRPELA